MKASLNRLAERAAEERLLDVAYTTADSPFGPLRGDFALPLTVQKLNGLKIDRTQWFRFGGGTAF